MQPAVKSKVPYDPFKSFTPIASVAAAPETISVHPSLPATNMKELIALLRDNPGKYGYASPGHGTSPHVAVERLFKLTLGLDVVHVPFQGGAPAVAATIAGHTQILHITLPLIAQHVKEGKLRGIAVADTKRSAVLPDLPTLVESGIPNHDLYRRARGAPPSRTRAGSLDPVPPLQVTDWLQYRRQGPMSKMDKFLADTSHRRACIFMTCSRPVTLTFSAMQYFLPRRVT